MGIVIAIIVFGLIIAIHEFGHFIAAKRSGVRVNEFAIGMGPRILKKQKGETTYSLRLFPIGGFCAMEGEDETSDDEHALNNKSVGKRLKIMAAGAIMNLLLGIVVVLVLTIMQPYIISMDVAHFEENSKSHATGLEIGDKIVEVNGLNIYSDMDLSYAIATDKDGIYNMTVKRDGKKVSLKNVSLEKNTVNGKDNIVIDFKVTAEKKNVLNVVSSSFKKSFSIARLVWIPLVVFFPGIFKMSDLSGPVGIVKMIGDNVSPAPGQTIKDVIENLLNIVGFITINVGIMNLLPLPALDGGRIMFLLIEAVRGKPVKPEHEGMVHLVGIVILMSLMVLITFNDIANIIRR